MVSTELPATVQRERERGGTERGVGERETEGRERDRETETRERRERETHTDRDREREKRERERERERDHYIVQTRANPYFNKLSTPSLNQSRIPAYLWAPQGIYNTIPQSTSRCALPTVPKSDKLRAEQAPSKAEHSYLAPSSQTPCR